MKTKFEESRNLIHEALAEAETAYATALREFTDKHKEGFHICLKDGDFETTISSQTTANNAELKQLSFFDLFDYLFK